MPRKKICILTSVHPAFDVRIFHKEAKTLVNAGYEVTIIAQYVRNETVDGIKIIALPKPRNRFCRFFSTFKVLKLALPIKVEIYHFHDPELLPAALVLKLLGKKVIYDVHEDVPKSILSRDWLPKIIRKPVSILVNCFEKLSALRFDYLITATPSIKNNFKIHKVIDIKNYPIINSTLLKNKSRGLIYQAHGSDKSDPYKVRTKGCYTLIYAGGLERNRGIKEIIQATELINPKYRIKLVLAGEFTNNNFQEECQNLEGWKKTEFLGWLKYEEVFDYLLNADIGFVCFYPEPNHIKALPNKLFEYMVAGSVKYFL